MLQSQQGWGYTHLSDTLKKNKVVDEQREEMMKHLSKFSATSLPTFSVVLILYRRRLSS